MPTRCLEKGSDQQNEPREGQVRRKVSLIKLRYVEPPQVDGRVMVKPLVGVKEKGYKDWECTLVEHFVGQSLSYLIVNAIVRRLWGVGGLLDLLSSNNRFFFFKFKFETAIEKILEDGPWDMVNHRSFLLKALAAQLVSPFQGFGEAPLWIKLRGFSLSIGQMMA